MRRHRATFPTPAELVAAHDDEMKRGGLLLRGASIEGVELFEEIELELAGGGTSITTKAQVVQLVEGVGIAVIFAMPPALAAWVESARSLPSWPEKEREPASLAERYRAATHAEKIQIALHGNRDERAIVLRDPQRNIHPFVLKNPHLQIDEVLAIARMTAVSPDLLKQIAERREWIARADIALALVRNHATPIPTALKLLDHVAPGDLRQLAKDGKTRTAIASAARKRVIVP